MRQMNIKNLFKAHPNEFTMIAVGLAFFLNPMIILFDILPDFIGCALIMLALHRLSPAASELENTFNYFKYMLFASVVRLFIALASAGFDNVTYLSASLIIGLAEAVIAVMAFSSLCDGLSTLSLKFSNEPNDYSDLRNIGVAFIAARSFASVLPYITSVFDGKDDDLITGEYVPGADYTALLTIVNIVITVIFAVFFMTSVVSNLGKTAKDKEFCIAMHREIEEKGQKDPDFFIRKNIGFALTLLAYSSLFLIDFIGSMPDGGVNFIPDFGFGLLTVWAVLLLGKYLPNYKRTAICGTLYTVFSAVNFFVFDWYIGKHYYTNFDMLITRFSKDYIIALIFSAVETVALAVYAVCLVKFLKPVAETYSIPIVPPEFVRLSKQMEKSKRRSVILLKGLGVFLIVIAIAGSALTAVSQLFDVGYGDINFPYIFSHLVLNIAFYAYASTSFLRMRAGVRKRYERITDVY